MRTPRLPRSAKELVPQMWMQKGVDALKLKDFATAADGFAKSYAADTTAGKTALYLGQALGAQGKTDEAIEAFRHAAWNGEEAEAKEQVSNIYVRQANAALKGQKFADAVKRSREGQQLCRERHSLPHRRAELTETQQERRRHQVLREVS